MTDWRKLAMAAILADGHIDEAEVKVLKKELYADEQITPAEAEFLVELRAAARQRAKGAGLPPAFESFFYKALADSILADGVISAEEAALLEKALPAGEPLDDAGKKFLRKLKKAARETSPEFEALYANCMT
jgi:uncharacterized membrane protein YebE (DUF533 family)